MHSKPHVSWHQSFILILDDVSFYKTIKSHTYQNFSGRCFKNSTEARGSVYKPAKNSPKLCFWENKIQSQTLTPTWGSWGFAIYWVIQSTDKYTKTQSRSMFDCLLTHINKDKLHFTTQIISHVALCIINFSNARFTS